MSKLEAGARAPEFSLGDSEGKPQALNASAVMLSLAIFFKTSCPTCHYAWKYYERLHNAYKNDGLRVLGISQHDGELTRNFRAQHEATFPHLLDRDFKVSRTYDPSFVPTGFLINQNGIILESFESWNSQHLNDLSVRLADRLGTRSVSIVLPQDSAAATKNWLRRHPLALRWSTALVPCDRTHEG